MKEYDWLIPAIKDASIFMPDIINKGYLHMPAILPVVPKIKLDDNLSSELNGFYVAGESSGIVGILSAMLTGIIVVDGILK